MLNSVILSAAEKANLEAQITKFMTRQRELEEQLANKENIEQERDELSHHLEIANQLAAQAEEAKLKAEAHKQKAMQKSEDESLLRAINQFKRCAQDYEDGLPGKKARAD